MPTPPSTPGLLNFPSPHSVPETLNRLSTIATSKGLTLFARIDFAADAAKNNLTMPPTQLLLLGNPKAETPIMLAAPTTAIDFPLKALAWQDATGQVWLSANTPDYLQQRHNFPAQLLPNIAALEHLLKAATQPEP